ncbi:hypothetical protein [Natrarchaeobius chitinivorans]|uniref:Uncharacterized protein n=1 Tax=Natrarchaeobius chitinivorans TaxID=1679083 RepID=A0A3N6M6F0_NATCH|nr:hypothetical protein [Natrarchaeobius chitinivorans]RQG90881.1 hypothetical protein EA473_20010 [Natrarchaeobius chitinivorans]
MGIGVTKFIAKNAVRDKISTEYPNPGADVDAELQVIHVSYEHSLLGQAFDYLIRFWLEHQHSEVHDPHTGRLDRDWTHALEYTRSHFTPAWEQPGESGSDDREPRNTALERAKKKHEQFRETGMNANDVIDAALVYSGLDLNVGFEDGTIEANSFEDDVVSELQDLFHLFREQDTLLGDSVILSPDFGQRSFILEGHGDFIVDQTLIDVKTTEDPAFKPEYWRQLLAYYVLNDIHRELVAAEVDSRSADVPYPDLTSVGVYFARFGELQTIDVDEYLQPRDEYERFRAWFVDRAIDENHDGRRNYDPYREVLTEQYDFEGQTSLFDF